jgi:hypothetical protein
MCFGRRGHVLVMNPDPRRSDHGFRLIRKKVGAACSSVRGQSRLNQMTVLEKFIIEKTYT